MHYTVEIFLLPKTYRSVMNHTAFLIWNFEKGSSENARKRAHTTQTRRRDVTLFVESNPYNIVSLYSLGKALKIMNNERTILLNTCLNAPTAHEEATTTREHCTGIARMKP